MFFFNTTDWLALSAAVQRGYVMGAHDAAATLAVAEEGHLAGVARATVTCMDQASTAESLRQWAVRRLSNTKSTNNAAADELMVYGVHPCTP
jgi:hypothetical protein